MRVRGNLREATNVKNIPCKLSKRSKSRKVAGWTALPLNKEKFC
jgi:hypothetical protein